MYTGHDVYYYSFGACEAFRRKSAHKGAAAVITFAKKDLEPQLHRSFAMWTTKQTFDYKLVHGWREHQPWCIYVMTHSTTEPKLETFQTENKTSFENVTNDDILTILDTVPSEYQKVVDKFEDAINLFNRVVPSDCLSQIRSDLKHLSDCFDTAKQKVKGGSIEKPEMIEVFDALKSKNVQLLEKVLDMESNYRIDITKEIQRNDICYQLLSDPLSKLNYICKPSIENSDICLFGKSLLDLYYYKDGGSTINATVLKRYETEVDVVMQSASVIGNGVVGGLAEFKVEGTCKFQQCSQTFADLVRVGTLLANNTLMRGRLVEKLIVYGLLINYNTKLAIIMKYYVNFNRDESVFLIGEEVNATKAFTSVLKKMDSFN